MPVSKRLRTTTTGGGNSSPAIKLVSGVLQALSPFSANQGVGDLRSSKGTKQQVITLNSFGGTDSFKVRVNSFPRPPVNGTTASGAVLATDTVAFVRGTNATAAAIQAALRTATGDTGLTVSGTTDAGPFTVTFVNKSRHVQPLFQLVALSGCSGNVTRPALTYDKPSSATVSGVSANGIRKDPTASDGAGNTVYAALGQSIKSTGAGQTRGTVLAAPTMVSAVGGSGQVVVDTTESASSGTAGEVLFAVLHTASGLANGAVVKTFTTPAKTDQTDTAGDPTITGLSAGDYMLLYAAVDGAAATGGRVGQPGPPEYFTVT